MAGISDIVLQAGQIIVTESESTLGIYDIPLGYQWGEIVAISNIVNKAQIGQNVLFNPVAAVSQFSISVTKYWIINESQSDITEPIVM